MSFEINKIMPDNNSNLDATSYYYQIIAENSLDVISIYKINGNCIYMSPSCAKILGYTAEELIGKNIFDFLHPDEKSTVREEIKLSLRETSRHSFEHRFTHKSGNYIWFESKGNIFINKLDNNKKQLMIISRDINERKESELKLATLSKVVEQSPIAISITDLSGKFEYVNPAFEKITGYSSEEIKYQNLGLLQTDLLTNSAYKELWDTIIEGNTWGGQLLKRRKNGELFWSAVSIAPLIDSDRVPRNYLAIFEDITELKMNISLLEQSEKRFRQIWECSADGMRLSDENGIILAVNDAYCQMVELKREQLEGYEISIAYLPGTANDLKEKYSTQFFKEDFKNKFQTQVTLWNNKKVYYDVTTSRIAMNGSKKVMLTIIRDITQRKLFSEQLKLNARRLQQALEVTRAGTWDWDMQNGKVYYDNNLLTLLGYSHEDKFTPDKFWLYTTHPDDIQELQRKVNSLLQNNLTDYEHEFRKICKDGKVIWVLDRGKVVEWDETGNPGRMIGTIMDITKNKLDEIALIQSEEKFKSLFNSAADSIFLLDLQGKVLDINEIASTLLGVERELIINKNLAEFINHNPKVLNETRLEELTKYGQTIFEETINSGNGGNTDIEISAKLIEYQDEQVVLCIGRDITDRKAAEEETIRAKEKAEEINRIKTNFLANMSHELRTPLVGILGFADLLAEEISEPEHKEMAQTIIKSGRRLLDTLSNVLNLSKIEANKCEIIFKKVDLNSTVRDAAHLFSAAAKYKGLQLDLDLYPDELSLELDKKLLEDILNNLLNNAIKFTEAGSVTLRTKLHPLNKNIAVIEVSDTGIGITKEHLGYIFEEFRQVSEGFNRSFEGTGLGLTVTKKFIELMNGKITVSSEVNIGTTFTIEFPVNKSVKLNDDIKLNAKQTESSTQIIHIPAKKSALIVEDDEISKKFLEMCLKDYCQIDTTQNGNKAVSMATAKNYDIIFMDINLGRSIDGLETTNQLRKLTGYLNIPIVAVTAYAGDEDKKEILSKGCSHYISKPYSRNDIIKLFKNIFEIS